LVTSGQVASIVSRPRRSASACTAGETPWAEKTVTEPSGIESSSSSTNTAPRSRSFSTTCLLWTISLRTYTGAPCRVSARSTVLHGPVDAGAVPARRGQQELLHGGRHLSPV
jgi:hypothetical protein